MTQPTFPSTYEQRLRDLERAINYGTNKTVAGGGVIQFTPGGLPVLPTGTFAGWVQSTGIPGTPSALQLVPGADNGQITITADWTQPNDIGLPVATWVITVQVHGDTLPPYVYHVPASAVPPFTINQNLLPNTTYDVSVWGISQFQASGAAISGQVTTGIDSTIPPSITGLSAGVAYSSIILTWTPIGGLPPNNWTGTYQAIIGTDSAVTVNVQTVNAGNASVASFGNLTTGQTYWARVRAVSPSGVVGPYTPSTTVNGFGPLTPGTPPSSPSNGAAPTTTTAAPTVTGGPGYLFVKWAAIVDPDVVTYEVHVSTSSGFTPATATKATEVSGTTAFVKLDGSGNPLQYGTNYYVRIYPKDADGYTTAGPSPQTGPARPIQLLSTDTNFNVGNGNYVRNAAFGGVSSVDARGGSTNTIFDDWFSYNFYPGAADAALTVSQYTTDSFWGPYSARLQWTTNTGNKGLRQATPVGANNGIVWAANTTWIISIWVKFLNANFSVPHLAADAGGFTDTAINSPSPVSNVWQRFDIQRIVGGANVTSNLYPSFTHANGNLLIGGVQVTQGDMPVSFSPRPDEILAKSVTAAQMVTGTITAVSGIIGSLDASVITTGTLNASVVTVTNLSAASISSGTIASNIVYAGTVAASQVTTGTLAAGVVYSGSVNASQVNAGTMAADRIGAGSIGAFLIQLTAGGMIKSASNYAPGVPNWSIDGNGNAILNNATIRGIIAAATLLSSDFTIYANAASPRRAFRITSDANGEWLMIGDGATVTAGLYWNHTLGRYFLNGVSGDGGPAWTFDGAIGATGDLLHCRTVVSAEMNQTGDFGHAALRTTANGGKPGVAFFDAVASAAMMLQFEPSLPGIQVTTGAGSYGAIYASAFNPSAARFKKDVKPLRATLDRLKAHSPVTFIDSTTDDEIRRISLIADEVAPDFPEIVAFNAENEPEAIHVMGAVGVLWKGLQEAAARLDALEGKK